MVRSAIRRTGTERASSVGLHCDSRGLGRSDSDASGRAVDRAETTATNVARATVPKMINANRRMHLAPQMSAKGNSLAEGVGICKEARGRPGPASVVGGSDTGAEIPRRVGQLNPSHMRQPFSTGTFREIRAPRERVRFRRTNPRTVSLQAIPAAYVRGGDCVRSPGRILCRATRPRPVACCWPEVRRSRGPSHFTTADPRRIARRRTSQETGVEAIATQHNDA